MEKKNAVDKKTRLITYISGKVHDDLNSFLKKEKNTSEKRGKESRYDNNRSKFVEEAIKEKLDNENK